MESATVVIDYAEPERKKPGPKPGIKKKADESKSEPEKLTDEHLLTETEANHIMVVMGRTWDELPCHKESYSTWEDRLDAIAPDWREYR
jgi:hypothetical protein